ncbi:MAG: hypothetical protein ACKO2K_01040, partial [Alphaproteobacteria bacterium]
MKPRPKRSRSAAGLGAMLAITAVLTAEPARAISEDTAVREVCLGTWFEGLTSEEAHRAVGTDGVPALVRLLADHLPPSRQLRRRPHVPRRTRVDEGAAR